MLLSRLTLTWIRVPQVEQFWCWQESTGSTVDRRKTNHNAYTSSDTHTLTTCPLSREAISARQLVACKQKVSHSWIPNISNTRVLYTLLWTFCTSATFVASKKVDHVGFVATCCYGTIRSCFNFWPFCHYKLSSVWRPIVCVRACVHACVCVPTLVTRALRRSCANLRFPSESIWWTISMSLTSASWTRGWLQWGREHDNHSEVHENIYREIWNTKKPSKRDKNKHDFLKNDFQRANKINATNPGPFTYTLVRS